jgi:hypothetical protein
MISKIGGFLVESVVEAVPQSILQMVAMVVSGQVSAISVFSVVTSMVSVASHGLMVSYSIDRPTFVFNFFVSLLHLIPHHMHVQ